MASSVAGRKPREGRLRWGRKSAARSVGEGVGRPADGWRGPAGTAARLRISLSPCTGRRCSRRLAACPAACWVVLWGGEYGEEKWVEKFRRRRGDRQIAQCSPPSQDARRSIALGSSVVVSLFPQVSVDLNWGSGCSVGSSGRRRRRLGFVLGAAWKTKPTMPRVVRQSCG